MIVARKTASTTPAAWHAGGRAACPPGAGTGSGASWGDPVGGLAGEGGINPALVRQRKRSRWVRNPFSPGGTASTTSSGPGVERAGGPTPGAATRARRRIRCRGAAVERARPPCLYEGGEGRTGRDVHGHAVPLGRGHEAVRSADGVVPPVVGVRRAHAHRQRRTGLEARGDGLKLVVLQGVDVVRGRPPVPHDGRAEAVGEGADQLGLDAAGLVGGSRARHERRVLGHADVERVARTPSSVPCGSRGRPSRRAPRRSLPSRRARSGRRGSRGKASTRHSPPRRWVPATCALGAAGEDREETHGRGGARTHTTLGTLPLPAGSAAAPRRRRGRWRRARAVRRGPRRASRRPRRRGRGSGGPGR